MISYLPTSFPSNFPTVDGVVLRGKMQRHRKKQGKSTVQVEILYMSAGRKFTVPQKDIIKIGASPYRLSVFGNPSCLCNIFGNSRVPQQLTW